MGKKISHDEYINLVNECNQDIEVLGIYSGALTPILHKCKKCDYMWRALPSNILRAHGCPKCAGNNKKTHFDFVSSAKINNPNVEVIGEYINMKSKIKCRCLKHDIVWDAYPECVLRGNGCKKCHSERTKTARIKSEKQYINELSYSNPNLRLIDKYKGANIKTKHQCMIDGYIWDVTPGSLLSGQGCPICNGGVRKSHKQYVDEVKDTNNEIDVIEEYINSNTPILHRCKICGNEWKARPYCILTGEGCPRCKESSGERKIRFWLENNDIKFISQKRFEKCRDIYTLPFDFYLPDNNCCVEYDGQQHYFVSDFFGGKEAFEKQKLHDKIKDDYCKEHGIKLLRIPYYKDIEEELNNFLFT